MYLVGQRSRPAKCLHIRQHESVFFWKLTYQISSVFYTIQEVYFFKSDYSSYNLSIKMKDKIMNVNQEQLLMFKTVMETGSFSAAARQLGKVPSAVSMAIANLEIDLNLELFQRIGREPKPTAQAQVLYEK